MIKPNNTIYKQTLIWGMILCLSSCSTSEKQEQPTNEIWMEGSTLEQPQEITQFHFDNYVEAVKNLHAQYPQIRKNTPQKKPFTKDDLTQMEAIVKDAGFDNLDQFIQTNATVAWSIAQAKTEKSLEESQQLLKTNLQTLQNNLHEVKIQLEKQSQNLQENAQEFEDDVKQEGQAIQQNLQQDANATKQDLQQNLNEVQKDLKSTQNNLEEKAQELQEQGKTELNKAQKNLDRIQQSSQAIIQENIEALREVLQ